ncbi:MAG: hypothetical protein AAF995_08305 [Planctomycetota bacterium]
MASEADKKPVWQILTRPRGHEHADWSIQRVEARSLLQAEAILRRRGFETDTARAVPVKEPADEATFASPPLVCRKCGYPLDGVQISIDSARCPECGFDQPLRTWMPMAPGPLMSIWRFLRNVFAMIGIASAAFIALWTLVSLQYSL